MGVIGAAVGLTGRGVLGIIGTALPLRKLFLTLPQPPSWAERTPATLANSCCLLPDRGNSSALQSSCNWSLVASAIVSGFNFFGS